MTAWYSTRRTNQKIIKGRVSKLSLFITLIQMCAAHYGVIKAFGFITTRVLHTFVCSQSA